MAQQIFAFRVTVAAGTLATAPVSTDISFDQAAVEQVEIIIPDGHAGLTGLALAQAHQQIIPQNSGDWLISNDEKIIFPVEDYLDNGSWQAICYNTDVYDHSFYVRFLCSDITAPVPAPVNPVTAAFAAGPVAGPAQGNSGVGPAPAPVSTGA